MMGLGTGRCGTSSLSDWLGIPHELKPYPKEDWSTTQVVNRINKIREVGDVSFANIWLMRDMDPTMDVIVLVREKDATVESFLRHGDLKYWREVFPKFPFKTRGDIEDYYDWYYDYVSQFSYVTFIHPSQIPLVSNASYVPNKVLEV